MATIIRGSAAAARRSEAKEEESNNEEFCEEDIKYLIHKQKDGKEGKDGEKGDEKEFVSNLFIKFAEFCTSDSFAEEMREFEVAKCDSFVDADPTSDHKHDWSALHARYLEIIEHKTFDFCCENDCTQAELFRAIQEVSSNPSLAEFVPQVILNTEYEHFAKQMMFYAEAEQVSSAALSAATETGVVCNVSGVYYSEPITAEGEKAVIRVLEALKCPWVFRKMLTMYVRKGGRKLTINQSEEEITISYNVNFFGTRHATYRLDNVYRDGTGVWNAEHKKAGYICEERQAVIVKSIKDSLGPGWWYETSFYLTVGDDNVERLVFGQRVVDSAVGIDALSRFNYVRSVDVSTVRSRRK